MTQKENNLLTFLDFLALFSCSSAIIMILFILSNAGELEIGLLAQDLYLAKIFKEQIFGISILLLLMVLFFLVSCLWNYKELSPWVKSFSFFLSSGSLISLYRFVNWLWESSQEGFLFLKIFVISRYLDPSQKLDLLEGIFHKYLEKYKEIPEFLVILKRDKIGPSIEA